MKHGCTAESMLVAIEEKLGYKLDPSPVSEDVVPAVRAALAGTS